MAVTIQQIADRVGVSPSTVSAALSPVCKKKISQKRISEICSLARKMGYKPNLSARRLRTGKTYNIGVVILSYLRHHPLMTYFDLVSEHLSEKGYRAIPLQVCRSYTEIPKQLNELEEQHVDGLLFLDYFREAYDQYLRLWQTNHSMVFRVRDPAFFNLPFDSVLIDQRASGSLLIKHVLSQGWDKLVFVTEGNIEKDFSLFGYYRAWFDFDGDSLPRGFSQVVTHQERSAKARYEAIKAFIGQGDVVPGKTALVLDGADGGSGIYAACQEAGLVIGRDIGVAAMNRLPINEFLYPELTVVSEPFEEIAYALVDQLIASIDGQGSNGRAHDVFRLKLLAGASTVRF